MSERRELYEHHFQNGNTRLAYVKETDPKIKSVTVFREVLPGDDDESIPLVVFGSDTKRLLQQHARLLQRHARLREKALAVNAEWVSAGLPIVTAAMKALRAELENDGE